MGVPLVMDTITVTNLFFHRSKPLSRTVKKLVILLNIILFAILGCQGPAADSERDFGKAADVTEDLYHRLQAGLFEIGKEPFICEFVTNSPRKFEFPFSRRKGAYQMSRISWDRGSFWVQTDDHALIVVYFDDETTLGHIQIAPSKGFQIVRQFREFIQRPVRGY